MKINGQKPNFYKSQTLDFVDKDGKIYTFTLTPTPLNFYDSIEKIIPRPNAPKTFAKDAKGKFEKDENGRQIIIRDEDDPKYQEKMKEVSQLQSTALVYEVLKNDKAIEFETKKDVQDIDFFRAIRAEMIDLIPMPIFLKLVETAGKMLSVSDEALKEAEENFR